MVSIALFTKKMKYNDQIKIRSYDVDMRGCLRPSVLLAKLEELGAHQMVKYPPSNDDLRKEGKGFFLSRLVLEIKKELRDGDVAEGYTYAADNSRGLSFNRCYELVFNGEFAAKVYTVWALLDFNEQKLLRVEDNRNIGGEAEAMFDMELPLRVRMPSVDEFSLVGTRKVYYSDTDVNGHMNNTKYIGMLCDFVPEIEKKSLRGVNISYVSEAPLGEELSIFMKQDGDTYYFRSIRTDGKTNCEAVLYF